MKKQERCKECGLRIRGNQHTSGKHHLNVFRKFGKLQKDDKGQLEKRTMKLKKEKKEEE